MIISILINVWLFLNIKKKLIQIQRDHFLNANFVQSLKKNYFVNFSIIGFSFLYNDLAYLLLILFFETKKKKLKKEIIKKIAKFTKKNINAKKRI